MEIIGLNDSAQPKSKPGELIITEIKPAVKDAHRVNIFINGHFSFSLMLAELADEKIKVGDIITHDRLMELKSISNLGKLYQRETEYACTRPHSEQEIRDHLRRKKMKRDLDAKRYTDFLERLHTDPDFKAMVQEKRAKHRDTKKKIRERREAKAISGDFGPDYAENNTYEYSGGPRLNLPTKPAPQITDQDIENIIEKLKANRIVDDKVFAKYYVENRYLIKGISERRLAQELKKKGIADSIIKDVLSENEYGEKPRNDEEEIMKLLDRKFCRVKSSDFDNPENRRDFEQKILAYLMRQGFSYELCKEKVAERFQQLESDL